MSRYHKLIWILWTDLLLCLVLQGSNVLPNVKQMSFTRIGRLAEYFGRILRDGQWALEVRHEFVRTHMDVERLRKQQGGLAHH